MAREQGQATCHPDQLHHALGLCKVCYRKNYHQRNKEKANQQARDWAARNKDKRTELDQKYGLKCRYGLTVDQYTTMVTDQGGLCAICLQPQDWQRKRGLAVDHDHKTGRVRGLLCHSCNVALGLFKDDPARLARAASYLERRAVEPTE